MGYRSTTPSALWAMDHTVCPMGYKSHSLPSGLCITQSALWAMDHIICPMGYIGTPFRLWIS